MKKRTLLFFSVVPFLLGYLLASLHGGLPVQNVSFAVNNILPTDKINLIDKGDIYQMTRGQVNRITRNQQLIEPVVVGSNIVAVSKKTDYSSLLMYDMSGDKVKTLFDGNGGNIDTMDWISDPAVNPQGNAIAYVSDKDRQQTNAPDNGLYVLNLGSGKSTNVANPDPYSGGITHPVFNPVNSNILLYDYYQYDPQTLVPYSTIEEYDRSTGEETTLTFEKMNAYQESFSPDGKQLLFLGRNEDLNTVTLYIAKVTDNGLSDIHPLLTGDIAYPVFSMTNNRLYYLYSEGNKGYNLVTGTIQKDKLIDILPVTNGFQLLGNSSFDITGAN